MLTESENALKHSALVLISLSKENFLPPSNADSLRVQKF